MKKMEIRGCTEEELIDICLSIGLKKFRGSQIYQWVQQQCIVTWDEIKNIGSSDKEKLKTKLELGEMPILHEQQSKDGTRKFLLGLSDGEGIECVLMDYDRKHSRDRHTVCLSTQVGCAVGCAFCATGLGGFRRNLTAGEIVGQVLEISHRMRKEEPEFQVTNIVFMGMGEPLLNYDEVMKAIDILNSEKGQNIGMRRMTISTSGVAPKIVQLARDNPQVGLAVSLHAADDKWRNALIPMNRRYPLAELMEACSNYSLITSRRITFEVALIADKTTRDFAEELAKLLKGQLGHVNLIPVNPVKETGMERPSREKLNMFAKVLEQHGIAVSIREERGTDIDAACGQLRRRWESEQK